MPTLSAQKTTAVLSMLAEIAAAPESKAHRLVALRLIEDQARRMAAELKVGFALVDELEGVVR